MCECNCKVVNELRRDYVIVRCASAGVFAGVLAKADYKTEVTLKHARRIWYWKGAASLSELALHGVKHPKECKFAVELPSVYLTGVIEIIPTSDIAQTNIRSVAEWRA